MIPCQQSKIGRALRLLFRSFLYSLLPISVTAPVTFLLVRPDPKDTFALLMLLEGGIGLLAGVMISLSNSPSAAKASEFLFKTAPWSREAECHAEGVGLGWMTTSMLLVLIGVVISTI